MQRILICYAALWTLTVSAAGSPEYFVFVFGRSRCEGDLGLWRAVGEGGADSAY